MRKQLAGLILGKPYRFGDDAVIDVRYPADRSTLLGASTAPAIRALRAVA